MATASAIIDFLAERDRAVGVQQVADVLGITKSRASRHLANLEQLGIVSRALGARGYQLGWRVVRWGYIATNRINLADLLKDELEILGEQLGRTVLLCASAGSDAIVIRCVAANTAIRIEVKTGLVLSLPDSPSARVSFAFQPKEKRSQLLEHLREREPEFRVEDDEQFMSRISAIQQNFFCWTRDKFDLGYGAVAAPVFDHNQGLAGVLTVMSPSQELDDVRPPAQLTTALLAAGQRCSRLLRSSVRFPVRTRALGGEGGGLPRETAS